MTKLRKRLNDKEAEFLGLKLRKHDINRPTARYTINEEQFKKLSVFRTENILELKKQTKNKNGEIISETYAKKQQEDDIDTSKFLPISFTTNPFGDGKWTKYDLPKQDR